MKPPKSAIQLEARATPRTPHHDGLTLSSGALMVLPGTMEKRNKLMHLHHFMHIQLPTSYWPPSRMFSGSCLPMKITSHSSYAHGCVVIARYLVSGWFCLDDDLQ